MKQAFNPYLPTWEYVPDGEPHVFDGRVYVYGSHDRFDGKYYCLNDYVVWSAPVDDLTDWHYHGISYPKTADPLNADGNFELFAPDVARGKDGRYYLYYGFTVTGHIGVAVSDSPAGPFTYYGHLSEKDGSLAGGKPDSGKYFHFDPAVLVDDDGRIWLYSGYQETRAFELADDMKTIIGVSDPIIPGGEEAAVGTPFEEHGFHEASSIRKIQGRYYFVYSSMKMRELCYAVSDRPDGGFVYGGCIVDNTDCGMNGHTSSHKGFRAGNNHGGILDLDGEYYIFYHRHTNRSEYSRQACAEKIRILPDGSIPQVEITSCGLNDGPLAGKGTYPATICCILYGTDNARGSDPFVTQSGEDRESDPDAYISEIHQDSVIGYRYYDLSDTTSLTLRVRGDANTVTVSSDEAGEDVLGTLDVTAGADWHECRASIKKGTKRSGLFLRVGGTGYFDLRAITLD